MTSPTSPGSSPSAVASQQPLAGTGLPVGVPYAAAGDPVAIESVKLSSDTIHGGDSVAGTVITTSNAASVTARVGTIEVAVPKIAPGTFHMEVRVPHLPLLNGRMNIVFTAIRADGVRAERTVPIEVTD